MLVHIFINDETANRLEKIAIEQNRLIVDLCERAISESALEYFRHRKDDPAKTKESK